MHTEQKVFSSWIPMLNASLSQVALPGLLDQNNFVIVSGFGFPQYLEIVENAARDVTNSPHFGQLVVSVDAEDEDPTDVRTRIATIIQNVNPHLVPDIVVQNACIESWFLGNRRSIRRLPRSIEARDWRQFYDVWQECPELMPARTELELNRAQTAFRYLIHGLRDNGAHIRYSKNRPDIVCDSLYLERLQERRKSSNHLDSFADFVAIF